MALASLPRVRSENCSFEGGITPMRHNKNEQYMTLVGVVAYNLESALRLIYLTI